MSLPPTEFRSGMRQLAAAVNVVTTRHDGARAGMTATAVMSLTAEPPQIAVAVNRANASYAAIAGSGVFAVNVLAHDHAAIASRFAGADGVKGEARFSAGQWDVLETGAPILRDSAASFDCTVAQEIPFTSHVVLVGLVRAIRVAPGTTPLLFMDGAWASLVRANDGDFAAYEQVIAQITTALDAVLTSDATYTRKLHDFSAAFIRVNAPVVDVLRDFYTRETFASASRLDAINQRKREVEHKLQDLLIRGIGAGEFDACDPVAATDAIIGLLNGIHRRPPATGAQAEHLAHRLADLVIAMVTKRRPAVA
ncbi:flavin reductase [Methylobacterium aquaticum]|uniref:flavin reductase n=1 Tax=Methylobacterium aquaticum TaxID=270351 RepID=UPI003D181F0E